MLHCLQLLPHTPYRDAECQKYLNMHPGQREVRYPEGTLRSAHDSFCFLPSARSNDRSDVRKKNRTESVWIQLVIDRRLLRDDVSITTIASSGTWSLLIMRAVKHRTWAKMDDYYETCGPSVFPVVCLSCCPGMIITLGDGAGSLYWSSFSRAGGGGGAEPIVSRNCFFLLSLSLSPSLFSDTVSCYCCVVVVHR